MREMDSILIPLLTSDQFIFSSFIIQSWWIWEHKSIRTLFLVVTWLVFCTERIFPKTIGLKVWSKLMKSISKKTYFFFLSCVHFIFHPSILFNAIILYLMLILFSLLSFLFYFLDCIFFSYFWFHLFTSLFKKHPLHNLIDS